MPRKPEPSFRLKQIIWDIAASDATDNLSAIYRDVDYRLEKLREEGELFENVPEERKVRDIIRLDIQRLHPEVVVAKLPKHVWCLRNDYEAIKQLAEGLKAQQEAPTETVIEQKQEPYEETPHKLEESLIVHDLSPGTTGVEFLVTNLSSNLLIVDRICVEVMHWEQYDAPLTTGARIKDYKYKIELKPNLTGEILVTTLKFSYAKGDVDSFSISFISPPGNKYIARINLHCSDPETGKRFTVSTDEFEIRFNKITDGGETLSNHYAVAQARKIVEAKRKK